MAQCLSREWSGRHTVMLGPVLICGNRGIRRMGVQGFIAGQLRKPTGFFGRHIAAPFMNGVNVEINLRTLEVLSVRPDDRVLEVGPGPGDLMNWIVPMVPRGSVTGADFSREMIDVCASADAMPCASDQFAKACTVNTIYF